MSRRENYEEKAEALLLPIAQKHGVSIYDVEYVKEGSDFYLRAFIDKAEGVNINDCENVSREFSDVLDREDFIDDSYILEVSSPGLGRTLKKDRHFANSIGQDVEIKLFKAQNGCKEFEGSLIGFDDSSVTVSINGEEQNFSRSDIAIIRLALDF